MNIEDYPSNSHRSKAEQQTTKPTPQVEKKVEKVATAKTRKQTGLGKFVKNFVNEDAENVKSYLVSDVLIPTIKNTIWDAFTNSLEMVLFGEVRRNKGKSSNSTSYVSYSSYSDRNRRDTKHSDRDRNTSRFDYVDWVFDSKGDAESVLDQMSDVLDRYNAVTVADLYDMCGRSAPYTSNKYGWTNLGDAYSSRVRDGYVIKLPKPYPID